MVLPTSPIPPPTPAASFLRRHFQGGPVWLSPRRPGLQASGRLPLGVHVRLLEALCVGWGTGDGGGDLHQGPESVVVCNICFLDVTSGSVSKPSIPVSQPTLWPSLLRTYCKLHADPPGQKQSALLDKQLSRLHVTPRILFPAFLAPFPHPRPWLPQ